MSDTSAVTPNSLDFIKFIKEVREEKKTKVTNADRDIALLGATEGWRQLKEFLLRRKARLLELKGMNLDGASYEEMGKLFYFARLVGDEIDAIIGKVENTRKVVDGE
jgi:hypothetical protein